MNTLSARQISPRTATWAGVGAIAFWCWSGVCFASGSRLLPAMVYLTCMSATGVATLVVLRLVQRRNPLSLFRLPWRVALAGFIGVAVYTVLLATAFGMARDQDLGQVSLLNYLWPVWMVLLAMVLLPDRPRVLPTLIGAALGFLGVAVARGGGLFTDRPPSLVPHAMAAAGAVAWALYCVLLRRWRVPDDQGGTALHFALCALLAAAVAAVRGEWHADLHWTPATIAWILFGGIGPVGLGYHWWELGIKRGSMPLLSQLAYFTPIGSSLLIAWFFRGSLSIGLLPGAGLIALGAWIAGRAAVKP